MNKGAGDSAPYAQAGRYRYRDAGRDKDPRKNEDKRGIESTFMDTCNACIAAEQKSDEMRIQTQRRTYHINVASKGMIG